MPVVATRLPDGTVRVRHGHRRTIAAIQAGRPTIPVYVRDDTQTDDSQTDDDATATVDRIVEQLAENTHRAGLTTTEHVHAVQQLSLLGVSAAQIAKRTHTRRRHVDAALALTTDDDVARATATSLTVAAWCAEFADDPNAVAAIERAHTRGGETAAAHEATRLRRDRAHTAALATAVEHIAQANPDLLVLTERPSWSSPATDIDDLVDIDAADHAHCPHHAVLLIDADIDDPDPSETDPGETGAGAQMATVTVDGTTFALSPWCTDWQSAGHAHGWRSRSTTSSSDGAGDDHAARQAARAERRRVIAGGRAWDAATEVRVDWIAALLARKALPKDAVAAIATAATVTDLRFGCSDTPNLASTADATRALLRLALTTLEAATSRSDWRHPDRPTATTTALLTILIGWGYVLAPVEDAAHGGTPFAVPGGTTHALSIH